jgi:hypothetical protein
MFHYLFVFYAESGCPGQMAGNGTLTFEVATTSNGPWVTYDQHTSQVTFQRTYNSVEGSLEEPGIPAKYGWYRFTYHASFPNNVNANGVTSAVQMCQAQTTTTPEVTPTITPASSSTPCTVSFSDVHPSDYFYQAVQYLGSHCAISGYADGTFRPFNNMTRGQVCKVVVLAFQIPLDTEGGPHFTDVPPSNPFYVYIETLYNRGIISGYADGTFRPYNNVTRGQFVKIICLVLGWPPADPAVPHFTDVPRGSPFYGYVEAATCGGLITGYSDGTFRPNSSITRGQVSQIIYRALMGASPCPTPTASP